MAAPDQLKSVIASLIDVTPAQITAETQLSALADSLGTMKLKIALKRLGVTLAANAAPAATFGQLERMLGNGDSPAAVAPPPPPPAAPQEYMPSSQGIGLDLQQISALPEATDFWEHPFYKETFSPTEIAYATGQTNPKNHFCAFWCSKEAAKKADPGLLAYPLNQIQVAHEIDGRPFLQLTTESGKRRLPHSLSITHSADFAAAVVLAPSRLSH